MPANLPPEYHEAEKSYRLAKSAPEKIEALELMLSVMPKHKGTDKLRAELRRRIAKLLEEAQRRPAVGRRGPAGYIRKEGAGQAVLVGLANVGKSQLLSSLTDASPEIADYPFTTQTPMPGMMRFENIQIQLLDTPPVIDRSIQSGFPTVLRNADLLLIMADLGNDPLGQVAAVFDELSRWKVRPVGSRGDSAEGAVVHKRALIIGNKNDLPGSGESYRSLKMQYAPEYATFSISAKEGSGLEELRGEVFRALDIIRVYKEGGGWSGGIGGACQCWEITAIIQPYRCIP
jgi:ribosome-interacting GTPase 1